MELVQIVDAALADAASRSGDWLVCKPGCAQCCSGVFVISALDADRLRQGLATANPLVSARVQQRVSSSRAKLDSWFPGDVATGVLHDEDEAVELFEEFAHDEVCPVLDPLSGTCDLYASRPILCRTFGPPVLNEDEGLAVCELCFHGATEQQTAACEMYTSWRPLQDEAEQTYEAAHPGAGRTMVAWAFVDQA